MRIPSVEISHAKEINLIILKTSQSKEDRIIANNIYASALKPSIKTPTEFYLIGETDALGTRVLAKGLVMDIKKIIPTSNVLNIFKSSEFENWDWEYTLCNVQDLRLKYLTIDDIFSKQEAEVVRHTQQFTYL